MLTNSTITAWSKMTGCNGHGEPVLTPQTGGPWPALLTNKVKKLKLAERDVVSKATVTVDQHVDPGFALGDQVTISGQAYTVADMNPVTHPTLGHTVLYLV